MDGVTFDTDGAGSIDAFWTESRIDPATVPEGWHRYSVRGGEDGWEPCSIEDHVTVNHTADILTAEDLGRCSNRGTAWSSSPTGGSTAAAARSASHDADGKTVPQPAPCSPIVQSGERGTAS